MTTQTYLAWRNGEWLTLRGPAGEKFIVRWTGERFGALAELGRRWRGEDTPGGGEGGDTPPDAPADTPDTPAPRPALPADQILTGDTDKCL